MSLSSTSSQELFFSDIPESIAGKSRRKSCLSDLRGKENMENGVPEASSAKRRRSAPSRAGLLAPKKRKSSSAIKLQKRASEDHFHLENSGEQATIMDELEYELEGARETSSISVRRGSTYNLAKLCAHPDEAKQLRSRGLCNRVLQLLDSQPEDEVVAMNVSLMAYFLLRDARNAELITGDHLKTLLSIAVAQPQHASPKKQSTKRPVKKRLSLSNTSEVEMKRSRELIEVEATINEWPEAEVHPFRVAIQTLRRLVEVDRGALKRALEEDDEPDLILAKLLALTERHIARVSTSDASDAYYTCLKLLEATTDDPAYQRALVPIIPSLLLAVPLCMTDEPLAGQCLVAILRVLINLTNENDDACGHMASNGGVASVACLVEQAWSAEATAFGQQKWNLLTLGLSLLVNLIEHNTGNRDTLGSLRTARRDFVEFVTSVASHWWSTDREADQVVIAGYAVLLMGYLAKDSEDNRKKIRTNLASLTPARSLTELSSALRHFLALHEHHRLLSPAAISSASQAARALLC